MNNSVNTLNINNWAVLVRNETNSKFQQFMDKKHKEMSDLKTPVLTMQENMLFSGEIYTTGKQFTLPPVVTNLTSGCPITCNEIVI